MPSNGADLAAVTSITVAMAAEFGLSFVLVPLLELEPLQALTQSSQGNSELSTQPSHRGGSSKSPCGIAHGEKPSGATP